LLADNAWFQLGLLYENALKDKEKAQDAFRKIVIDFPGSLYQPEARKHYRKLRGDSI
jgi:outer membrane protein assembly factor BamD (BamD/ComL family)